MELRSPRDRTFTSTSPARFAGSDTGDASREERSSGCFFFWSAMATQKLWQVLRECRARQNHIASHLMRLLLQVSLDMRQESNNGGLFQLGFKLRNEG